MRTEKVTYTKVENSQVLDSEKSGFEAQCPHITARHGRQVAALVCAGFLIYKMTAMPITVETKYTDHANAWHVTCHKVGALCPTLPLALLLCLSCKIARCCKISVYFQDFLKLFSSILFPRFLQPCFLNQKSKEHDSNILIRMIKEY